MGQRKRARELVLKCLYAHESTNEAVESISETLIRSSDLSEEARTFAEQLFVKVVESIPELDDRITQFSQNWDVARLAIVDKCILRMGICELSSYPDIPARVSINEAVELAKKYSTLESSRFVNGILDAVYRNLEASGS
jgi:N utilization substance protein B